MNARRAAIAFPVVVTVAITAVVGVLIATQNQRQSDQMAAADIVAEDYLSDVASFRVHVAKLIKAAHADKPAALKRVVDTAIATPPTLPALSGYGMKHSTAYREAVAMKSTLLAPYRRLSTTLELADTAVTFVAAARKVLALRATDYVGFDLISSSSKVRSELIPPFVNARDAFDEVEVPRGQEELAATVRGAAQYVINQATTMADRIDARQSFSFSYSKQFQTALDAVSNYATTVSGDVTEAINAVMSGP